MKRETSLKHPIFQSSIHLCPLGQNKKDDLIVQLTLRVPGLGFGVWDLGFGVLGLRFGVWGLGSVV